MGFSILGKSSASKKKGLCVGPKDHMCDDFKLWHTVNWWYIQYNRLDKSVLLKFNFTISQRKHMLWILKNVSLWKRVPLTICRKNVPRIIQNKEEGKDQESIRSNTTPDSSNHYGK